MCWAVPLLAVGVGGVQVKGSWCPVVWGSQGVCAGPCSAPLALLTIPLGWDRRDTGAAPKHIPVNTCTGIPGTLGVGLEGQQKPLS